MIGSFNIITQRMTTPTHKIKPSRQEVLTHGGEIYVFAHECLDMSAMAEHCHTIPLLSVLSVLAPIL